METAVRNNFLISGWVAVRQREYARMGTIIMLTRAENIEAAQRAEVIGVADMQTALDKAYAACRTQRPMVTIMPQGANTFPILTNSHV